MLGLKLAIAYAIPDMPSWVAKEMAKIEHRRREVEKRSVTSFFHQTSTASSMSSEDAAVPLEDKAVQTAIEVSPLRQHPSIRSPATEGPSPLRQQQHQQKSPPPPPAFATSPAKLQLSAPPNVVSRAPGLASVMSMDETGSSTR